MIVAASVIVGMAVVFRLGRGPRGSVLRLAAAVRVAVVVAAAVVMRVAMVVAASLRLCGTRPGRRRTPNRGCRGGLLVPTQRTLHHLQRSAKELANHADGANPVIRWRAPRPRGRPPGTHGAGGRRYQRLP